MNTRTINTYSFNELSEQAKKKALEIFYDINVNYEWWENIYYDAKIIGLDITGFDIDRGAKVDFGFIHSHSHVAQNIMNEHGEGTDTHAAAKQFFTINEQLNERYEARKEQAIDYNDEELCRIEADIEQNVDDFKDNLEHCYLKMLREEYNYLMSDEAIIDSIEANDYEFLITGKQWTA
jgi:hypothetical protein